MAARKKRPPRDNKAGHEPSVRTFTTWTPTLITSAEIAADGGNLRQAASLCEWILGDDRVSGALSTRVQALLGLEPNFEPSGDKRRSRRVVKALEAGEDWWAAYPESELAQLHTWGLLFGLCPARHNWEPDSDHGNRLLPKPAFWHPQHLRFDWTSRAWWIRIAQSGLDFGGEELLVPGDGTWLLHTPYGINRPWSLGLWRGLARWVLLKWYAIQDWARHGEKGALLVAFGPEELESTRQQRAELAQDIYDRGRDAVAVLPPGWDLKLVEATANTKQIYEAQIAMADAAIAISIRGGNLSTNVEQGSRAAAEVQERTGDQAKRRFDAQSLTTTVHDQSLVWWAEFNFGDRRLAPWPVYPVDDAKDVKRISETANTAADAAEKFSRLGFDIDRKAFADEFGLATWLKPGDGIPKPAPPAPAPAAPRPLPEPEPDSNAGTTDPEGEREDAAQARNPRLASGDDPRLAAGYVDGQLYADRLADRSRERGAENLSDLLEAVEELIDGAESLEEAETKLVELYRERDIPPELRETLEAMIQMAHRAGIGAVQADTPEHEFTGDNDAAG